MIKYVSIQILGIVLLSALVGCGKAEFTSNPESTPQEFSSLEAQIEAYSSTSEGRGIRYSSAQAQIAAAIAALLDVTYGLNPAVTRVVLGTAGTSGLSPNSNGDFPTFANKSTFDKDVNGKFQLVSGNPGKAGAIPYSALYLFLEAGLYPVAAGGTSFCAGTPGTTQESGVAVAGLAISTINGAPSYYAGYAVRNGTSYQACDISGCTGVSNLPPGLVKLFPICNAVLGAQI